MFRKSPKSLPSRDQNTFFLPLLSRSHEDVWIGAKEKVGLINKPAQIIFTDGTTHDYIPDEMVLNDGGSCLKIKSGVLGDFGCESKRRFLCTSAPVKPEGNTFLHGCAKASNNLGQRVFFELFF